MPAYGEVPLDYYSSTCLYSGVALSEALRGSRPIGLVHTAWGGSTIEQWLTNDAIGRCHGADVGADNGYLFDAHVRFVLLAGATYDSSQKQTVSLRNRPSLKNRPSLRNRPSLQKQTVSQKRTVSQKQTVSRHHRADSRTEI